MTDSGKEHEISDSGGVKKTFPGKFGRKVGLMLAMGIFLVLVFGTIPLWFSLRILSNSEEISRLNKHIRLMEGIHSVAHHVGDLIFDRATGKRNTEKELNVLIGKLLRTSDEFRSLHMTESDRWADENEEKVIFEQVVETTNQIVILAADKSRNGQEIRAKARSLLPKVIEMAAVHEQMVNNAIAENHFRMRWIFNLYYALIFFGVLVIGLGIFWISRSIVRPVTKLATAAREISDGDFSKRVQVTSDDELGQLSHSFNTMASRLQEHERYIQGMAALEERERLAREMHDGLAQNIGFMNLKVAELGRRLKKKDIEKSQETLSGLREMVGELYNEVRQAIFGLRIMVSRQLGLLPTLTEYLHEFSQQTGIQVDVKQEEREWVSGVPVDTEIQLIRIIQEALTNVRKHAGATKVYIHFKKNEKGLEVVIEDDGCGLSKEIYEAKEESTFGLQTMKERAEGVGGSFEIENGFPVGAKVTVCLPLAVNPSRAEAWSE